MAGIGQGWSVGVIAPDHVAIRQAPVLLASPAEIACLSLVVGPVLSSGNCAGPLAFAAFDAGLVLGPEPAVVGRLHSPPVAVLNRLEKRNGKLVNDNLVGGVYIYIFKKS